MPKSGVYIYTKINRNHVIWSGNTRLGVPADHEIERRRILYRSVCGLADRRETLEKIDPGDEGTCGRESARSAICVSAKMGAPTWPYDAETYIYIRMGTDFKSRGKQRNENYRIRMAANVYIYVSERPVGFSES